MAITEPDGPPSPPSASEEPPHEPHPAARWTLPLVLLASGAIWGLIAHLVARH